MSNGTLNIRDDGIYIKNEGHIIMYTYKITKILTNANITNLK